MTDRYFARSASDKTDDWPWWFIADKNRGGLNVTSEVFTMLNIPLKLGAVFTHRLQATEIAELANKHMENLK
jgi:hypothetical protein